jgi:hypothetical protein
MSRFTNSITAFRMTQPAETFIWPAIIFTRANTALGRLTVRRTIAFVGGDFRVLLRFNFTSPLFTSMVQDCQALFCLYFVGTRTSILITGQSRLDDSLRVLRREVLQSLTGCRDSRLRCSCREPLRIRPRAWSTSRTQATAKLALTTMVRSNQSRPTRTFRPALMKTLAQRRQRLFT